MKHINIIFILTFLLLICLQLVIFNGFDIKIWEGLNLNFITEILGVVFTYYIIDKLIRDNDNKKRKSFLMKTINNEFSILINRISALHISFVTKLPPIQNKEDQEKNRFVNAITQMNLEIDKYVNEEFISKKVKVIQVDIVDNNFEQSEIEYDYQNFNEWYKKEVDVLIEKFLIKYIVMLPENIIEDLSKMNNILKQPVFTTSIGTGLYIDISGAKINTIDFKSPLLELGGILIRLSENINVGKDK